mgnify:CR=1 FL=1
MYANRCHMNFLPKYYDAAHSSPSGGQEMAPGGGQEMALGGQEWAGKARYCLALDLKDDPQLIAAYERHHQHVWPEIIDSIRASGIEVLEIYRTGNRMFMIIEAGPDFSWEKKAAMDAANPVVQQWETLMWKFQQALPWAKEGEKWVLMEKIFEMR